MKTKLRYLLITVASVIALVAGMVVYDLALRPLTQHTYETEFVEPFKDLRTQGPRPVMVSFHGMMHSAEQTAVFDPIWDTMRFDVIRPYQPGDIYDDSRLANESARHVMQTRGCAKDIILHGVSMGGQAARKTAIALHETCGDHSNIMLILDNSPYGASTLMDSRRDLMASVSAWPYGPISTALGAQRWLLGASDDSLSAPRRASELHSFTGVEPASGELDFARVVLLVSDKDRTTMRLDDMEAAWRVSAPTLKVVHSDTDHATYREPADERAHQEAMVDAVYTLIYWPASLASAA